MALNKDFIVKQGLQVEGTTVSANTASGALLVAGGAGIGGDVNIQGYLARLGPVSGVDFTNGAALKFAPATYTDTANVGTVAWNAINYFGQSLLDTTNTNVTVTNAASIFIQGAPTTASTNLSIINRYSIYVTSGTMYLGETRGSTTTFANQALQVEGGIGFKNGITGEGGGNFSGTYFINASEIITRATANVGVQEFPNELRLLTNTDAISTSSGALQLVNGGAGIAGNIYVGGRIVGLTTGTFLGTNNAINTYSGALTLSGGLGVGQDLYARNGFFVSGDFNGSAVNGNSLQVTNAGGLGVSGTGYFQGPVKIDAGTDAANTASGSLIVTGGLGVSETIHAQKIVVADLAAATDANTAPLVVAGGVGIGNNLIIGSTDSSTGTTASNALIVAGGVAIGKDLLVDNDVVIKGDLLLLGQGTQVVVNSTQTYIVDPVIEIGGGVDGALLDVPDIYDKGLLIHYQYAVNTVSDYRAVVGLEKTNQHFFLKNNIIPDGQGKTDVSDLFNTGSWATLDIGSLIVHDTTPSLNPSSGAITVAGGIGVGGNSYFGTDTKFLGQSYNITTTTGNTLEIPYGGIGAQWGYFANGGYINGAAIVTTGTVNQDIGGIFTNSFRFSNITESWSTDTGAVVVDYGLGVGGNVHVGGTFVSTGSVHVWSQQESSNTYSGALVVNGGVGIGLRLNVGGNVRIYSTTSNFTSTDGALVVDGGVGIGGNVHIGDTLDVGQSARIGTNLSVISSATIYGTGDANSRTTGALIVAGGMGVAETIYATRAVLQTASINSGTVSTDTTSGDLTVTGGVGIGGDVWIDKTVHILAQNTVTSTTGTGALEVWGGVGIGEGLKVAGTIERIGDVVAGKWTINGPGLHLSSSTYTDTNSVGVNAGTAVIHSVNKPFLIGTLNPTWRDIATLYIENAPEITGGAQSANKWALLIEDGQVKIGSNSLNNGSTNTGALVVGGGIGAGGSITSGATVKGVTVQVVNNEFSSTSTYGISSNSEITVDTWNGGAFRTAKYIAQIIDAGFVPNKFHVVEIMIAYDGSAQTNGAYISQYGIITNNGELGDFNAVYDGGLIRVTFTPNYVPTNMAVQILRTAITSA